MVVIIPPLAIVISQAETRGQRGGGKPKFTEKFKEEGEVKSYLDLICIQIPDSPAALFPIIIF